MGFRTNTPRLGYWRWFVSPLGSRIGFLEGETDLQCRAMRLYVFTPGGYNMGAYAEVAESVDA